MAVDAKISTTRKSDEYRIRKSFRAGTGPSADSVRRDCMVLE